MMKRTKNLRKRGLALFLALVMCFGLLQTTAWAVDGEETAPTDDPRVEEPSGDNENTSNTDGATGGDDVDTVDNDEVDDVEIKDDTPDTGVTSGPADKDTENAGDTTPSDDPDHAGYPWAEDKE